MCVCVGGRMIRRTQRSREPRQEGYHFPKVCRGRRGKKETHSGASLPFQAQTHFYLLDLELQVRTVLFKEASQGP